MPFIWFIKYVQTTAFGIVTMFQPDTKKHVLAARQHEVKLVCPRIILFYSIAFIKAITGVSVIIFGKVGIFGSSKWPQMAKMDTKPWLESALTVRIGLCISIPFIWAINEVSTIIFGQVSIFGRNGPKMAKMAMLPWSDSALTVRIGFYWSIPFIWAINEVATTIFDQDRNFGPKWPKMAKMA